MTTDPHPSRPFPPGDQGSGTLELAPGVRVPVAAISVSFSRSSGPGGQNVNKLSTKAELRLRITDLPIPAAARDRLAALAGSRVTADGELIITSESERSQGRNKDESFEKLRDLLIRAMHVPKARRATKPSRGSKQRRLDSKKRRGEIKRNRRDVD